MLLDAIRDSAAAVPQWAAFLGALDRKRSPVGIHLAVFRGAAVDWILDGTKTVESRFSRNGCAPFGRTEPGDTVLMKRSSGPVVGVFSIARVWDWRLTPETWREIEALMPAIRPQARASDVRTEHRAARYATLLAVSMVRALPPLAVPKRDRRGWVVLRRAGT